MPSSTEIREASILLISGISVSGIEWVSLLLRVSSLVPPAAPCIPPSSGRGRREGVGIKQDEHPLHAPQFRIHCLTQY